MKKDRFFKTSTAKERRENRHATMVLNAKIIYISAAALLFLLGVILFAVPEITALSSWCYILGGVSILLGASKLFGFFSNDLYRLAFQFDFACGAFMALVGIALIAAPDRIIEKFITIYLIYVILNGLLKIQIALDARRFGMHWAAILTTAIALALVGIGALIFPQETKSLLPGVVMMADAAVSIWITAYTVRVRAQKKNLKERLGETDS